MPRRKKTHRPRKATEPRPAKPDEAVARDAGTSRRLGVRALQVVIAAVLAVALVWGAGGLIGAEPSDRIAFPPPRSEASTSGERVVFEDFAGSDACEECHKDQYDAWRGSTHQKAGGRPNQEVVIAPFDGRPMRFSDAAVRPSVNAAGEYVFTVVQPQIETVVFRVDGVIGRANMFGGGTQGFVSLFDDGTVRFLPFDFHPQDSTWFCNTGDGFTPIDESLSIGRCIDWPPFRILGTDRRSDTCQECHGSQIILLLDAETGRYDTKIMALDINCESCHGPSKRHVDLAKAGVLEESDDIAVKALSVLDKDASLDVCFRCHALKGVLEPGYLPGRSFDRHYTLRAWLVGDNPYFPDGRIRSFAYQQNHVYSDCYLNGSMTCVDCHDPHSQEYRDIWGRALEDRFSDDQCTDCHPSKADRPEEHTFHEPGTAGSRCIDCHMPYLQHPAIGQRLRFARSDHTIPVPRPGSDDRMGIVNACSQAECHADSTLQGLVRVTEEWYGELKPRKSVIEGLLEAPEVHDRPTAARLLLHPQALHPTAQVAALGYFIQQYLQPDMQTLEPEIVTLLKRLAEDADLDVRAAALATLQFARGEDPDTRQYLVDQLRSFGENDALMRGRWAVAIQMLGNRYGESGDAHTAIRVYQKGIEVTPRHAGLLLGLAWSYNISGDYARAVEYYERALEANPDQPLVQLDLRIARESLERQRR